jgi:hypothetical protein
MVKKTVTLELRYSDIYNIFRNNLYEFWGFFNNGTNMGVSSPKASTQHKRIHQKVNCTISSLTSNQIWLLPLVDDCKCGHITKFGEKFSFKKKALHSTRNTNYTNRSHVNGLIDRSEASNIP